MPRFTTQLPLVLAPVLTVLAGCSGGGGGLCPAATTERLQTKSDRLVRFCLDAAELAHGPYREERRPDVDAPGVDPGPPWVEGAFVRGEPDGAWRYRFPDGSGAPTDAVQYLQGWLGGLEHGAWEERDAAGRLVAEQRYDHGRRCDTWRTWQGDAVTSEVAFAACASLPPIDGPDPGPSDGPDWDGVSCPSGERVVEDDGGVREVWCEISDVRVGPYRYDDDVTIVLGSYLDGVRDGRWRLWIRADDGALHLLTDGHFAAGVADGAWTRWHPGGALAEQGTYAAGQATGDWTRYYTNGLPLERGVYADGAKSGVWERFSTAGTVTARVTWQAGRREGEFRSYYDDGAPECEGAYADDLRTGDWTCYHLNGALLLRGAYVSGLRDGAWAGFDAAGEALFAGAYAVGRPVSTWRFWLASDLDQQRLVQRGDYVSGVRSGSWETRWEADDALAATMVYAGDVLHGPWQSYYHDGQAHQVGDYVSGEQHGRWRVHHPNGQLAFDVHFFYGVRHGAWLEWWPNGQPKLVAEYVDGNLQPGAQAWSEDGTPVATGGEG